MLNIFEVYATGNTTHLSFREGYELNYVFLTLLCYRFALRTILESYTLRKWRNFEQFRFILIIFEVHVTGNTAQLDFCERYELPNVPPTPLCYRFDLGTTLK